jgi:hypothetical protein
MDLAESSCHLCSKSKHRSVVVFPVCEDEISIGSLNKPPRALSYPIDAVGITSSHLGNLSDPAIVHRGFHLGPVNDITFLSYPHQLPPQHCGPFDSERQFLEAFAFPGCPPTRTHRLTRWPFEKTLEVYDVVASLFRQSEVFPLRVCSETFHFAHGDLSENNILVDPDTGAITGIVDSEMAGFRPAWLSAVAAGWFNDDAERFLMSEHQSGRGNYSDDTPTDALVRAHFRLKLVELDEELFRHHVQGIELRALFESCCNEYAGNTEVYLDKYSDHEWPTGRRGPFPFDFIAWVNETWDYRESLQRCISLIDILVANNNSYQTIACLLMVLRQMKGSRVQPRSSATLATPA